MIVLAVDPGVRLHGWVALDVTAGITRRVVIDSGHDSADKIVRSVIEPCGTALPDTTTLAVEVPAGYLYAANRGAALLETTYNAGLIAASRPCGVDYVRCRAGVWRRLLTGKATPKDDEVRAALEYHVRAGHLAGLPQTRTKAQLSHVLDALGLALVVSIHGADKVRRLEDEAAGVDVATRDQQTTLLGLGTKRRTRS